MYGTASSGFLTLCELYHGHVAGKQRCQTHGPEIKCLLIPSKKHSSVLLKCSPAATTTKHHSHRAYLSKSTNQGETQLLGSQQEHCHWQQNQHFTLEHLCCRLAKKIRRFKPLSSLQSSFSKKLDPPWGRIAAAAHSWLLHTAVSHSVPLTI